MLSDALQSYFMRGGEQELVAAGKGLRYSLAVMVSVSLWSALHYLRAARTLRDDLLV